MTQSRFRTRGGQDKSSWRWQNYAPNGTLLNDIIYPTGNVASSNLETMTDTVTKDFKRIQSSGGVVMNAKSQYRERVTTTPIAWEAGPHPIWGRDVQSGDRFADLAIMRTAPAWYNTRVAEAKYWTLVEAYNQIASEDFMGLVTVAESGKTARMLASPLAKTRELIARIVENRNRKVWKDRMDAVGAATSAWLEYRLGWKVLLYEIEGIWDAWIANTQSWETPVRRVATRSHKVVWNIDETYVNVGTIAVTGSHESKIKSGVLYELVDESLEMATARRMGLRLSDVPASLWELVPHSWIVDRYISIGSWLGAISPKPGVRVLGNWTTEKRTVKQDHKGLNFDIYVSQPPATNYPRRGGGWSIEGLSNDRSVNAAISIPAVNPKELKPQQVLDQVSVVINELLGIGIPYLRR